MGKLRCRRVKWLALVTQQDSGRAGDRHPAFLPVPILSTGPHWVPRRWDLCYQNIHYISKPKREVLTNVHGTIQDSIYWCELFSLQLKMEFLLRGLAYCEGTVHLYINLRLRNFSYFGFTWNWCPALEVNCFQEMSHTLTELLNTCLPVFLKKSKYFWLLGGMLLY